MSDYTWTVGPDGLEHDLQFTVGLEIAAVRDVNGESMERLDDSEDADLFSVYARMREGPAYVIADRNTYDEAMDYARELGEARGLEVCDMTDRRVTAAATLSRDALIEAAQNGAELGACDED